MQDPRLLAKPPVTRLGCLVLVRNRRGDVLLVSGLLGARFVPVRELPHHMAPAQAARVTEALASRALPVLLHGQRAA